MSLLLIRHGETAMNVSRILQPEDVPLSDRGQDQAAALARKLAASGLAAIVCSDLPRARQTAEHIARATGLAVTTSDLLRERDFGQWRGRAYDELAVDPLRMEEAPPGGESMQQFLSRTAAAFAAVLDMRSQFDGPLAVVSHGLVLRAILERHARLAAGQRLPVSLCNTSISMVAAQPPHFIEAIDDASHLDGSGLARPPGILAGG